MKLSHGIGVIGLLFVGAGVDAEVSYAPDAGVLRDFLVMAPLDTEGSPAPVVWTPYRQDPTVVHVNPTGATTDDGRPDAAVRLDTGYGAIVWAHRGSTGYNVFFQEWDATGMSNFEVLASSSVDELDPSVFVDVDGTTYVAWWHEWLDGGRIYLRVRNPGEPWSPQEPVLCDLQSGRRPSIGVVDGSLQIAWEADTTDPAIRDIRVSRLMQTEGCARFISYPIATTNHVGRLDPVVHVEAGRLWVDWKQSAADVAFAAYDPETRLFDAPGTEPRHDPSWVGVEAARLQARRRVLGAP